jgi:hypothetical protein
LFFCMATVLTLNFLRQAAHYIAATRIAIQ